MLHRAILGSLERFYGVYLEHTGGAFPAWLAPVQVICLPVTDRALAHAEKVAGALAEAGLRTEVDRRNEKLGFKIREAQLQKIPFVLVMGDKEVEQNAASVRLRNGTDLGLTPVDQVLKLVADEAQMPRTPLGPPGTSRA
jgi:threonyl-tRNA synthetase